MQKTELPFVFIEQNPKKSPIMVSVPHCGRDYPKRLFDISSLNHIQIRGAEDFFVDELSQNAPSLGLDYIYANTARAYIDLNRNINSLDDKLIDGLSGIEPDEMARAGQGLIPRLLPGNLRIANQKIGINEANERIETVYRPYHDAIAGNLEKIYAQFSKYLLIDMHSMPNSAVRSDGADIVVGDCFGRSCDTLITNATIAFFKDKGLKARANRPYAGGFTTQNYGAPRDRKHVLQIEINRALYIDENNLEKTEEFEQITELISAYFGAMIAEFD